MDVVLVFEVGCLWAVAEYVIGDDSSGSFGEVDEPLFSCAFVHGLIVLPVHVPTIEIVVQNKLPESSTAYRRILTSRCRKFTIPKHTHHYLNPCTIVQTPELLLNVLSVVSERIALREVGPSTSPYHSHVFGTACAAPESKDDDVVVVRGSIARYSQPFSY